MKKIRSMLVLGSAVALALGVGSGAARADEAGARAERAGTPSRPAAKTTSTAQPDAVGADLGTGWNILQIPASAFIPRESTMQWGYLAPGYVYWSSGSGGLGFWAPVQLPSGAAVSWLDLYAYDTSAGSITAILRRFHGWGGIPQCVVACPPDTSPGFSDVAAVTSIGASGAQYVYAEVSPAHTISNNVVYGGGAQYTILVTPTDAGNSLAFKGADLWWKRQIAPAPATARFTDVPLGAAFFAEVEALAASGITAGCTGTQFCPEAPLTRRQMAAFLARALGLYYQY